MSADDDSPTPTDAGRVELSVPADAQFASTVRTVAASLGADVGFSIDELDDIRLALSEVFSALVEVDGVPATRTPARVHVSFALSDGAVRIDVRSAGAATDIDLDELALGILRSVTDDLEVTPTAVVLVKHASEAVSDSSVS